MKERKKRLREKKKPIDRKCGEGNGEVEMFF